MTVQTIGLVIARLRKEQGKKQEELAGFVGVSTQAVSKWENGGMPDCELLPKIADFFKVSIDTLFGRTIADYSDVEKMLYKRIHDKALKERFEEAFELCWTIEKAMFGRGADGGSISDYRAGIKKNEQQYSSIRTDEGYTLMAIANRLPYFLLVPEYEDKDAALFDGIDYLSLFAFLSQKEAFDALVFLYKRSAEKAFTPKLLVNKFGMTFERALEIIKLLCKYSLVVSSSVELDDVTEEVYTFDPNPAFPALLIFARELIDKPNSYSYYMGGRLKPYLL